ncbi:hypothetical protein GLOTRDRAFT_131797 [Gloeophyllum trabeum ATCC 11539]|uniref:DUF6534 domain-containing protein n=1 Tax=Gloeophyllum trabeum (strain ATCC 11539 / FP-39264 / Madison 617) TaxID=670483 RepID=S7PYN6_GLOTA|nr:uncharacterized protein GLOTRDRAFT_131797 [Gloeophyllum trabeum ATCC 11539]EPQ52563.1 hypothetical protein GLOTRDRAFT_131797 [Gloeophyllum trabeum ATCC 11539]
MSPLDLTFGALFNGALFSHMMYGLTCAQAIYYFRNYSEDSTWVKATAGIVWIMDTLQQLFLVLALWFYLIGGREDTGSAFGNTNWALLAQVVPSETCVLVVECFYIRRIWILSRRSKRSLLLFCPVALEIGEWMMSLTQMTLVLTHVFCALIVIGVAYAAKCFGLPAFNGSVTYEWLIGISGTCRVIADLGIAVSMIYILCKSYRGGVTPKFNSLIRMLAGYALATGVVTSIAAIGYLAVYLAMPLNFVYIGVYVVHEKIYVNSILASLNSRETLRSLAAQELDIPDIA